MTVSILPSHPKGCVAAPPSKSMAHRYLIAAALSEGISHVAGIAPSEDILATIDCLRALGANITVQDGVATVRGFDPKSAAPQMPLACRESGSTLRFLLPLCWLSGNPATLSGSARLLERPLSLYAEIAAREGLTLTKNGGTVTVCGRLSGGEYTLRGDVSSQFITGLLFALPFTGKECKLHLLPPIESRSYLDLTVDALARFGSGISWIDDTTLLIPANDRLQAADVRVEGDYSNAAFFDALAALGYPVSVTGLSEDSAQGDRIYREYFKALDRHMPTLSLADCPDLGPILMALAAAKNGARLTSTRRLRIKESDRGAAMAAELAKFGARVTVYEDEIVIEPTALSAPSVPLCGHNDHRIVMSLATLLVRYGGSIEGAEAVKKSFPDYFTTLRSVGAEVIPHENE